MIMVLLRFSVAADRVADLRSFLARAVPYYEAPGGIRVRLMQATDTPEDFVEVVEYRDQEAYERDRARMDNDATMKALLAEWRALHAGPLRVETYREVAT